MSKVDVRLMLNACMEAGDVQEYCRIFARYYDVLNK